MTSDHCPICKDLSEKAVSAIAHHVRLVGKLEVAEIHLDRKTIDELRPAVDEAVKERRRTVDEYRRHREAHADQADAETAG